MTEHCTIIATRIDLRGAYNSMRTAAGEARIDGTPDDWTSVEIVSEGGSIQFNKLCYVEPMDEFCKTRLSMATRFKGIDTQHQEVRDRLVRVVDKTELFIGVVSNPGMDFDGHEAAVFAVADRLEGFVFDGFGIYDAEGISSSISTAMSNSVPFLFTRVFSKGQFVGYELHIERENDFLAYDHWLKSIEALEGVRLYSQERYDNDPDLEQPLPFHPPEGTAEMQFGDEWIPVFYWHGGSVTFKLGDEEEKVLTAALALAERMQADVRGDAGEQYTSLEDLIPPEFR